MIVFFCGGGGGFVVVGGALLVGGCSVCDDLGCGSTGDEVMLTSHPELAQSPVFVIKPNPLLVLLD